MLYLYLVDIYFVIYLVSFVFKYFGNMIFFRGLGMIRNKMDFDCVYIEIKLIGKWDIDRCVDIYLFVGILYIFCVEK